MSTTAYFLRRIWEELQRIGDLLEKANTPEDTTEDTTYWLETPHGAVAHMIRPPYLVTPCGLNPNPGDEIRTSRMRKLCGRCVAAARG